MWQFSEAIDGLSVACTELGTPITGGNVSFYNETLGKSIYPTPVIGILGVIEDSSKVMKLGFRNEGDTIFLLDGVSNNGHSEGSEDSHFACEFSSSEYSKTICGIVSGEPPAMDLAAEKRLQDCLVALAAESVVASAHDISDGGIAVTLAESCFAANGLGAHVKLEEAGPVESVVFGERGARAVISAKSGFIARVHEIARHYGMAAVAIGQVTRGDSFRMEVKGRAVIDSQVAALRDSWANSLERMLKVS
ncbi:MAG: hypothetical protein PVS2B2_19710 [Candidatus Acidiferrum sp.]